MNGPPPMSSHFQRRSMSRMLQFSYSFVTGKDSALFAVKGWKNNIYYWLKITVWRRLVNEIFSHLQGLVNS